MVFIVIGLFLLLPVTRTVPNPCLLRIQDFGLGTGQTRTGYGRVLNIGLIIRYVEKTYLEFLTAKLQITCKNSRFFETFSEIFRFIVYQFENLSK
ncbi:hypothetical protein DWW88_24070 [Bacteroides cellulosilyticus]|nr:hypothetical protein DWW88_24070 [Bacteroides cellulosilyticus]